MPRNHKGIDLMTNKRTDFRRSYVATLVVVASMSSGCSHEGIRNNENVLQSSPQPAPSVGSLAANLNAEPDCGSLEKPKAVVSQAAKTIEGTIVGHGGRTYWSNVIIESLGSRFELTIDSWSPDGKYSDTLPGVKSGQEIPIGVRVRIVSATSSASSPADGPVELGAERLIRLSTRPPSDKHEIDQAFQNFASELVSAVRTRDQAKIKSLMASDFEVSFPPYKIEPAQLFAELDERVIVNCDRPNCDTLKSTGMVVWDRLHQALVTGTRLYRDAEPNRIIRVTNSQNNTLFFERLCNGKWRWIRYLGYPSVLQFSELG